ncbi:MAG TPA: hypothetical protein VFN92_05130 [Solirubrobacterales bacterium]|nr:hypothetical protein [Solirubrobacterales bacterium]
MAANSRETLEKALEALRKNPESPEAAIADVEGQALSREREASKLNAQAKALRDIANGIRTLSGQPPISTAKANGPDLSRPEGMEAVRRIMKEEGGVWNARQLLAEMKKRGWESKESDNPIRPTEAAISRLWRVKKEIERVGRGQYRYIGAPDREETSQPNLGLIVSGPAP